MVSGALLLMFPQIYGNTFRNAYITVLWCVQKQKLYRHGSHIIVWLRRSGNRKQDLDEKDFLDGLTDNLSRSPLMQHLHLFRLKSATAIN